MYFTVLFPDRVSKGHAPACSCMMVSCGSHKVERGVRVVISANSQRDAWDKMKHEYPFERIIVLG